MNRKGVKAVVTRLIRGDMSEDDRVPCSLMVVVVVVVSTIGDNGGCRQSRQVGDKVTESMVAAWPTRNVCCQIC